MVRRRDVMVKFESKSARVKGVAFHPTRPWMLTSLHNGSVQLWDYQLGCLIERFDGHEGPVRSVDFHKQQPLFVSGGDDYKIKVWDHNLRRCIFTLSGHLDYIRTVCFHHEYPWILSASDDQTVRIWNWQSRKEISSLGGHGHYVMCAQFHPAQDFIVSASLDMTVRVWDFTQLRKKNVRGIPDMIPQRPNAGGKASQAAMQMINGDWNKVPVRYILEGHDRGVNWACFHPTLSYIASCSDDFQVKLWRFNENKAWEVATLRGHTKNVSCVMFHPMDDVIISNSEDHSIRVWDLNKRVLLKTEKREHDRFWILANHPNRNIIAAGHDTGMLVFKLHRERPAFTSLVSSECLYIKDGYMRRLFNYGRSEATIFSTTNGRMSNGSGSLGANSLRNQPHTLTYNYLNTSQAMFLITYHDGSEYELRVMSRQHYRQAAERSGAAGGGYGQQQQDAVEPTALGTCLSVCFVSRTSFAVLDRSRTKLIVRDMNNAVKKQLTLNFGPSKIFGAAVNKLLISCDGPKTVLYDITKRKVVSEVQGIAAKYVVWNRDRTLVALLSKTGICLVKTNLYDGSLLGDEEKVGTNNESGSAASSSKVLSSLHQMCIRQESLRIKSGVWSETGLFIYTTSNHIKYLLPNGDSGTIKSLRNILYAFDVVENIPNKTSDGSSNGPPLSALLCLDRSKKLQTLRLSLAEPMFKLALLKRRYRDVLYLMQSASLNRKAIISYIKSKGFPEIALYFEQNASSRFKLALECGDLRKAVDAAKELNDKATWLRLAEEALYHGNHSVVELSLQRVQHFSKLSFLYLISGEREKLSKMCRVAEIRDDVMSWFQNTLLLGDKETQCRVLSKSGNDILALICARRHGLGESEFAKDLESKLGPEKCATVEKYLAKEKQKSGKLNESHLVCPPRPVQPIPTQNWPLNKPPHDSTLQTYLLEEEEREKRKAQAMAQQRGGGNLTNRNAATGQSQGDSSTFMQDEDGETGWGDEGDSGKDADNSGGFGEGEDDDDDGFGFEDDADDDDMAAEGGDNTGGADGSGGDFYVVPVPGVSLVSSLPQNSNVAGRHAQCGAIESAMGLLTRQLGITNFKPMKEAFTAALDGATMYSPSAPLQLFDVQSSCLVRGASPDEDDGLQADEPSPTLTVTALERSSEKGTEFFRGGKFQLASYVYKNILYTAPLIVANTEEEENRLKDVIATARELIGALQCMKFRKAFDAQNDSKQDVTVARSLELACYLTHFNLDPVLLNKVIILATKLAFKSKNFITANNLAQRGRVLVNESSKEFKNYQKVIKNSQKEGQDRLKIEYDPRKPFQICNNTFVALPHGTALVCPYCQATYAPSEKGKLCSVCDMAEIGKRTIGLVCRFTT